jgi:hypothetical protein
MSLICGHRQVHCSSPRWFMSTNNHIEMMSTQENFWFVHQSSLAILPAESSGRKQEEWGREWWICPCKRFFYMPLILQHGASNFTHTHKEGMLWMFIALKNPLPWLALNMWTLGPMASILTITPPRRHVAQEAKYLVTEPKNQILCHGCMTICLS